MTAPSVDITILVGNQAAPDPLAEHGLSLWIRTDSRHILFDTGQGQARPADAETQGINLRLTDQLVLSHGHYDHTGGLEHLLKTAPQAHVYGHPGAVQLRCRKREGGPQEIQMPGDAKATLDRLPEKQLHWTSKTTLPAEAIGLTVPHPSPIPLRGDRRPLLSGSGCPATRFRRRRSGTVDRNRRRSLHLRRLLPRRHHPSWT